ncbi:MAG: PspC domain-containing protein [Candidatus Sumerlaeaceae bacterium]
MSRQMVWARNFPDRKLLGVASCIAHNLGVSPTLVRLLFVLLTFVSLLGLFLYIALALLIPAAPGQRSAFEAVVDAIGAAFDNFRSQPVTAQGIAGSSVAGECTSTAAPSAANAQAAPAPVAVAVPPPPPDSGGTPGTGV